MKALRLLGLTGSIALSFLLLSGCWKKLSASQEIALKYGLKFPPTAQVQIVNHTDGFNSDITYIRVELNQAAFAELLTIPPFDQVTRSETGNPLLAFKDSFPGWTPEQNVKGRGGLLNSGVNTVVYFFDARIPDQVKGWLMVGR